MYKDCIILITGGTGSWGRELVRQLLPQMPQEVRIFSRGECAQVEMARNFQDERLKFIIGDIRDEEAVDEATKDVDYIFHLAALKHVPVCELQPQEALKTNIIGTNHIIKMAIKNGVKKVIDVSTDKAVNPHNLYGMTKAIGERLIIQANQVSEHTRFICIRGGNVIGSNGSVVPLFIKQIQEHNEVTITDKLMTRYFMTLPEAIHLLFKGVEASYGGETFVMRMPSYYIEDIANVLIEASGKSNVCIKEVGMRPGEKIDEVLISEHEALNTFKYDDTYYLIMPTLNIKGLEEHYKDKGLEKVTFEKYTSADELLGKGEIITLLKKANFL